MIGATYITIYMSSGKKYRLKYEDKEEFLAVIYTKNGLVNNLIEIADDLWVNPQEIANFEVEEKLLDW